MQAIIPVSYTHLSPAIIVVGDVVSLNDRLDFFEKRPLFGRKITVPYIKTNELIAKLQPVSYTHLGIEDIDDLKDDFAQAFANIAD